MTGSEWDYESITSQRRLAAYCDELRACDSIGFDTEFVSERTYVPELCLIQVAAGGKLTVIDPLACRDVRPFWDVVAEPGREVIVHAGREETFFCLRAVGKPPAGLVDVQIGAGLIGTEYPAGYGTLVSKLLGVAPDKGETRTDWRKRPLSERQLRYALSDVVHLHAIRDCVFAELQRRGRRDWLDEEMTNWVERMLNVHEGSAWRKLPRLGALGRRSLAVARELWQWREEEAARVNRPARHVLRDDLIVELAKRKSADPARITAVRGMDHRGSDRVVPIVAKAIERAIALPDDECPEPIRFENHQQLTLTGQFLATAMTALCRDAEVAAALVGSSSDLRDLAAHRLGVGAARNSTPSLLQGWRAKVIGDRIEALLDGRLGVRIIDAAAEQPLSLFEIE